MVKHTDVHINWQSLSAKEIAQLIKNWGTADPTKAAKAEVATAAKLKVATAKRVCRKHTGADGEVRFLEHRGLFVGFFGGKIVVTKPTAEKVRAALALKFGV